MDGRYVRALRGQLELHRRFKRADGLGELISEYFELAADEEVAARYGLRGQDYQALVRACRNILMKQEPEEIQQVSLAAARAYGSAVAERNARQTGSEPLTTLASDVGDEVGGNKGEGIPTMVYVIFAGVVVAGGVFIASRLR